MPEKPQPLGKFLQQMKICYGENLSSIIIEAIFAESLRRDRIFLIAHPEHQLTQQDQKIITQGLVEAQAGKPLPYITGKQEFFGHEFLVNSDVLIPRPETESLVEQVITYVRKKSGSPYRVLEIGTGSGAIAISLALSLPDSNITAVDISPSALLVAQRNAKLLNVPDRMVFHESNLFSAVNSAYEIIVANLPYIERDELAFLPVAQWEPLLALDGGEDGLELFRCFFKDSGTHLSACGFIALEIGWNQGDPVTALARDAFPESEILVHQDLSGNDRVVTIDLHC